MKFTIQTITPKKAMEMLANNPDNRLIRKSHVAVLANEMASGRWQVTAQGISLTDNGQVVDGQHRLSAVIIANTPVQMMVATGVTKEAIDVYDIGAKRSVSDTLHIRDGLLNSNLATAACKQIAAINYQFQTLALPVALVRDILAEFGNEIQDAIKLLSPLKQARKAWIVGAVAFAMRHDKSIRRFAEDVGIGEGLSRGMPAMTVRSWLINNTAEALSSSSYRAAAQECLFNVMLSHSKGVECNRPTRGMAGLLHYRAKAKVFIESIRPELQRIRGDARKSVV